MEAEIKRKKRNPDYSKVKDVKKDTSKKMLRKREENPARVKADQNMLNQKSLAKTRKKELP